MRHPLVGVLVGAAGILVAAGFWPRAAEASHTKESSRASIVVRTYTQADSEGAIRTALRTASAILGRAGVEVAWLECGLPAGVTEASGACTQPLRWNELVVRILPAGTVDPRRHLSTLGFAFVDLDVGGGSLATVYADRVGLMAQSAGVDAAELLGMAMAHEIGHLLLGTNRHASRGLMRASWSSTDLRRSLATQWVFDGKEGDVMRKGIASRLAAAPVGVP
jgi:hypothetical protein